jgi:hypothetical protein
MTDIARYNNTIARWWAHEKLRLTDVDNEENLKVLGMSLTRIDWVLC